jgi:hypothetical protein
MPQHASRPALYLYRGIGSARQWTTKLHNHYGLYGSRAVVYDGAHSQLPPPL